MEANHRFRKQTFKFEQANEKSNLSVEIAVGRWPNAACCEQRFAETKIGDASERCQGYCHRLRGQDQEAALSSGWRQGWPEAETNGPIHPAKASKQAAEGETRPNRDDCSVIYLRNGLPD